jgi:hypothetical protein
MINFRFHLVSLVAVFLALALGVVMGSTVIDRAIVDRLSSQIESVRRRSDARRAENEQLRAEQERLRGFIDQVVPQAIGQRLQGVPVAMVAMRGVDGDTVRAAAETLRSAGASVPGVAWIEPLLAAPDQGAEAKLGQAVGVALGPESDPPPDAPPGTGPVTATAPVVVGAALDALGHRLAAGVPAAAATSGKSAPADLLLALSTAGFLAFDTLGGPAVNLATWPARASRLLVIDGSQAKTEASLATLPLVRSASTAGAAVTLAEVFRPTSTVKSRGGVVRGVRETELGSRVATVDDLEETRGRVALALAVEELGHGRAGHYGEGPGATRQVPEPPLVPTVPTGQAVPKP